MKKSTKYLIAAIIFAILIILVFIFTNYIALANVNFPKFLYFVVFVNALFVIIDIDLWLKWHQEHIHEKYNKEK